MKLDALGPILLLLLLVAGWAFLTWLGYYVFYCVIKAAVRKGIDESTTARSILDIMEIAFLADPDEFAGPQQP